MGSREAGNAAAAEWLVAEGAGRPARAGTFAEAAASAELVVNATSGHASLAALDMAGAAHLAGKPLIDVANPLDFSQGFPPTLSVKDTDSLAEQIQRAFPNIKVVKALNTMTAAIMVNPSLIKGEHDVFLCGNDAGAKSKVSELLTGGFGWQHVIDLGDLTAARGQEMAVIFWIHLYGALQSPMFNLHIAR